MTARILLGSALVALLMTGLVMGRFWTGSIQDGIAAIQAYVQALGVLGWLLLAGAQVLIAASGVLPASIVGIVAGAAYGLPLGFALSAAGTLAGAMVAFWLSRSVFRPAILRVLRRRPRLQQLDRALARDGWRMVCLLRISPIMPFAVTSYTLGLSAIRRRDYVWGTLAAMPALALYVFLGTLADAGLSAMRDGAGPLRFALLAAGVVATVALTFRVGQIAVRAMNMPEPCE